MKKNNLISGALILSIGSVLAKVFSAVYRIALTRILGGEGIGLYQLIFPFYSLCVVFATAGLPMAISKVVLKNPNAQKQVVKKCLMFSASISLILTFILLLSSRGLAILQGQVDLAICYIILAPTIIFVSVSSVLRGYFQGKHNFTPSAMSNIIEQFLKLVFGLVLSVSLISVSLMAAIIGAVVSIVLSEIVSLFVLLVYIKKDKMTSNSKSNISVKYLLKDVLPITLTNIVLPISSFIDSVLVVNLLKINFSNSISVFMYGLESGAVSSLVSLPTIFSFAIASVILPNIAHQKHELNKNHSLSFALKTVLIITIPCVLAFVLVPNRLIHCLYGRRLNSYGINGLKIASQILGISGIGVMFLALSQVYSSSLQAVDCRYVTVRNLSIAVILKLVVQVIFMPSKMLNIYAYAIANVVCYATVMILNRMEIKDNFKVNINYMFWAKLVFSNAVMLLVLVSILALKISTFNTILAILCAMVAYLICLFKTNIINRRDKAMFKYKV